MKKPPFAGVLLITVWSQGGKPVARLRGYEDVQLRPREEVCTGTENILARVAEWLEPFEGRADSHEAEVMPDSTRG